jgi:hypothetical protein
MTPKNESLKLKSFKQPLFILDTHQMAKFRTEPNGGAFTKPMGGDETSIDNKSNALHEAFLGGHEISKDQ